MQTRCWLWGCLTLPARACRLACRREALCRRSWRKQRIMLHKCSRSETRGGWQHIGGGEWKGSHGCCDTDGRSAASPSGRSCTAR